MSNILKQFAIFALHYVHLSFIVNFNLSFFFQFCFITEEAVFVKKKFEILVSEYSE